MNKRHIEDINDALFHANEAALEEALRTGNKEREQRLLRASDIIEEMQDILRKHIHELAKATQ
jgi:acyl-CoA reductase-like NAD-dependent aldehyde dehydrogenase